MANRPIARKVTVVLKNRDPQDILPLLETVEKVYRPRDLEIRDERHRAEDFVTMPDEVIETELRSHVADLLDRQDEGTLVSPLPRIMQPTGPQSREMRPSFVGVQTAIQVVRSMVFRAGVRFQTRLNLVTDRLAENMREHGG